MMTMGIIRAGIAFHSADRNSRAVGGASLG